ncbi:MAG: hypothetical protein INR73_04965 [Williamsia sp.]|nr:hypothetical protein [Williamsia sp.]
MKYAQLILFSLLSLPVLAQTKPTGAEPVATSSMVPGFWTLLLLALVIGLGVYLFWIVQGKLNRYRHEIEALKTRFSAHLTQVALQPGTNDIKKQVEMLVANHPKWGDTQEEINALITRLESLETGDARPDPTPQRQESMPKKEKRPQTETFYMTFPVGNYFPITAKSETRDNTIYKFKVRPNKTEADFEVHTAGAPMQELIGMVQTYIKPACDEENMASQQVRTIVTSQPGLAVLEGDKWIIKKKALIRYE